MVTISGYLDNLSVFVSKMLSIPERKVTLKEKDQEKVLAQVPKRKPFAKNFSENDPRIEKI